MVTHNIVQYSTVMYCTVVSCPILYCTILYYTVLYYIVLYCTVLYCTVLYCTVLHCTVPHSPLFFFTSPPASCCSLIFPPSLHVQFRVSVKVEERFPEQIGDVACRGIPQHLQNCTVILSRLVIDLDLVEDCPVEITEVINLQEDDDTDSQDSFTRGWGILPHWMTASPSRTPVTPPCSVSIAEPSQVTESGGSP